MAGSVIQVSGIVLFEDVLKAGTLILNIGSVTSFCTTPGVNLAPHLRSHRNLGVQCGVQEDLHQSNIGRPNGHAEFQAAP